MKVLICDDHAIVRKGLRSLLLEHNLISEIIEVSAGFQALEAVSGGNFDLIILDITLPDINGIEVLKNIKRNSSRLPVLMVSMHPEEQYAVRAMQAGAAGYIAKDKAPEELIDAIKKIRAGKNYLTQSLAAKLMLKGEDGEPEHGHEALTDREFEIMKMIAEGAALKDIADKLFLSEKTVSTYRHRILEKMHFSRNSELTIYAFIKGLIRFDTAD